ncbi:MAG TPA: glycosyltransferase [Propioniciclava sp.]|uniref:glycosyltransferase n=1 Tax=Propioniciclava sp. TaxID=2038686 RepID=UPI002C6832E1|nr:glycosyltransferase [Propioniciclava sp.]HRL48732.1 glycosyltransferase [Propioniciclava sp.]HRL78728.1 glycosyltransferase [Propioniciclava sp.]
MGVDATVDQRIVAVVVAWNRRDLLAENLAGLAAQTRPPDAVVVIDNASTDDSAALAARHPVVTEVVSLPTNTGGAGGFAAGIARAIIAHGAEAVWIMDDDTVPTPTALEELQRARVRYPGRVTLAASRADWRDGREHPMNLPRERLGTSTLERRSARLVGGIPIRSASFVSILLDADAIRTHGLPLADYFLWNDDFEYTARLLRKGVGLYVPASRVYHLTKVFGSSDADPGPRFTHEVRNKVWLFGRSGALGPLEWPLYVGATGRRWVRMVLRSKDRSALLGYGRQGLREAAAAPRTTTAVLAGTPVAPDVASVEAGAGRG